MDKEDCIQVLLTALQQPLWKSCDSVTDWDLKNVLWKAGHLRTPQQVAALFADTKRRGLISGHDRRGEDGILMLWGVKITAIGEGWLAQRDQAPGHPRPAVAREDSLPDWADPPTQASGEEEAKNGQSPDSPPPPVANAMEAYPELEPPYSHQS